MLSRPTFQPCGFGGLALDPRLRLKGLRLLFFSGDAFQVEKKLKANFSPLVLPISIPGFRESTIEKEEIQAVMHESRFRFSEDLKNLDEFIFSLFAGCSSMTSVFMTFFITALTELSSSSAVVVFLFTVLRAVGNLFKASTPLKDPSAPPRLPSGYCLFPNFFHARFPLGSHQRFLFFGRLPLPHRVSPRSSP